MKGGDGERVGTRLPETNSMESQNQTQARFCAWVLAILPVWIVPRMMVTATVNRVREKMPARMSFFRRLTRTRQRMAMGRQRT
jgi:hypothetical protein